MQYERHWKCPSGFFTTVSKRTLLAVVVKLSIKLCLDDLFIVARVTEDLRQPRWSQNYVDPGGSGVPGAQRGSLRWCPRAGRSAQSGSRVALVMEKANIAIKRVILFP